MGTGESMMFFQGGLSFGAANLRSKPNPPHHPYARFVNPDPKSQNLAPHTLRLSPTPLPSLQYPKPLTLKPKA